MYVPSEGRRGSALAQVNPLAAFRGGLATLFATHPPTAQRVARLRAIDLEGKPFEAEGTDLFARAMQHELDHLDAKLLADYVGRIKRQLITRKLQREAEEEGASD